MIRRDYLLRMIEQCIQALARITKLTHQGELNQARAELDEAIQGLAGMKSDEITPLNETELTALLLQGEPTQVLGPKGLLMVALLRQAGDLNLAQGQPAAAQERYLQALNLLLSLGMHQAQADLPDYVPSVETLLRALDQASLPARTWGALMHHYERVGAFALAEDALYEMLESEPANAELLAFGARFYERLLRQSDHALEQGNLPRAEVEEDLADWRARFPAVKLN